MDESSVFYEIETVDDLVAFVITNFYPGPITNNVSHSETILRRRLTKYPYRSKPAYLKYLFRVLLLAAEFGYTDISHILGGFSNYQGVDLFDPRYLAWTAYQLSDINFKLWIIRESRLRNSETKLTYEEIDQLFSLSATPEKGVVDLNVNPNTNRKDKNLPIYLPDIEIIARIRSLREAITDNSESTYSELMTQYYKDVAELSVPDYLEKYSLFFSKAFQMVDINELFGDDFQNEVKIDFK